MITATLHQFREAFNAIQFLDRHALIAGGVEAMRSDATWTEFARNPVRWVLMASPEDGGAVWRVLQANGLPVERAA